MRSRNRASQDRDSFVEAQDQLFAIISSPGHSVPGFPLHSVRHCPRVAHKFAWIYNRLGISFMQVSKWGNSLAVRLPAVVVEALDLKEGDEIEISIAGKRDFKVARDRSKERALEQLRQMKWSFPPDFKFNREEINER